MRIILACVVALSFAAPARADTLDAVVTDHPWRPNSGP